MCCLRLMRRQPLQALHVQLLEERVHSVVLRQLLAAAELRNQATCQLHAMLQQGQCRAVHLRVAVACAAERQQRRRSLCTW